MRKCSPRGTPARERVSMLATIRGARCTELQRPGSMLRGFRSSKVSAQCNAASQDSTHSEAVSLCPNSANWPAGHGITDRDVEIAATEAGHIPYSENGRTHYIDADEATCSFMEFMLVGLPDEAYIDPKQNPWPWLDEGGVMIVELMRDITYRYDFDPLPGLDGLATELRCLITRLLEWEADGYVLIDQDREDREEALRALPWWVVSDTRPDMSHAQRMLARGDPAAPEPDSESGPGQTSGAGASMPPPAPDAGVQPQAKNPADILRQTVSMADAFAMDDCATPDALPKEPQRRVPVVSPVGILQDCAGRSLRELRDALRQQLATVQSMIDSGWTDVDNGMDDDLPFFEVREPAQGHVIEARSGGSGGGMQA